jgi:hypothetical protein
MLANLYELIAKKKSSIQPLPEEMEICRALIQDKKNDVIKLQEEISLLEDFLLSRQLNSAGPVS